MEKKYSINIESLFGDLEEDFFTALIAITIIGSLLFVL
jgi:hypothetical protein